MANRHNSPWDAELIARAAGLKRAGFTSNAIAKKLGVTARAVNNKMSRTGVKSPSYVRNGRSGIQE
jgi:orotate phosphoribosyltransferase-like protein